MAKASCQNTPLQCNVFGPGTLHFHGSTFECLASDFSVSMFRGSINDAVTHVSGMLADT